MVMAAAGKYILDVEAMQNDFFADSALIGIGSASPAYQFCWMLNKQFDINFVREPEMDVKIPGKKDVADTYFPVYQYVFPTGSYTYLLYNLKTNNKSLLPEVKQLDYLWMIQSSTPAKDAATFIKYLRHIPQVLLAQILEPGQLKNVDNLLL